MAKSEWEFNPKNCTKDFLEVMLGGEKYYDIWVYATEEGDSSFLIRNIKTEQDFELISKDEVKSMMKFIMIRRYQRKR